MPKSLPSTDQMKRELDAYHGSPHLMQPTANNPLGEFDPTKIGSGEGAQAFGYGHYLAEERDTAKGYSESLARANFKSINKNEQNAILPQLGALHATAKKDGVGAAQKLLDSHIKNLNDIAKYEPSKQNIDALKALKKLKANGEFAPELSKHLYHIRIPHEHVERMLDWDKPLSEQHPHVQAAIRQELPDAHHAATGRDLYSAYGATAKAASDKLRRAGVSGIKYTDALSRINGDAEKIAANYGSREAALDVAKKRLKSASFGNMSYWEKIVSELQKPNTRNFVVFPGNEHMMKIVKREAKGGLVHEGNSVHVIQHKSKGGSVNPMKRETKAKFLENSKVKDVLYRGGHGYQEMPEGFMKGEARTNYATFASTSPHVASSYAAQGGHKGMEGEVGAVVPMHIKAHMLHEFPVTIDKRGHRDFDKFAFDRHARTLAPGHALVARQVYDAGPRASNETDPKQLWSYPSDIYAWNKGTETKSAFDKASGGSIKSIPDEPGSTPIKEGHVRLYHQTDGDNLRKIEKEGLLFKHAKGIEGPRAIYAGETPFYGKAEEKPTLEFQVPKEHWQSPFVLSDVMPKDIIAAHYPWHRHARYLEDEDNKQSLENTLSGEYDKLDGDTGKAVKYIKAKYGVNKAGGGSVKEPKSTVPAYKLFRVDKNYPGKLFPLFVDSKTPVEKDKWVEAKAGDKTGDKVKSKIGPLANRPGWHAGDLPVATHIGEKSNPSMNKPDRRPSNQVWAEVDMPNDVDWQSEANKRGTNAKGKLVAVKAHITDQVPKGGHYRYKTNPNMTGNWLIGGSMKVKKVLPDEEVQRINNKAGASDLPRDKPIKLKDYGFNGGGAVKQMGINVTSDKAAGKRYADLIVDGHKTLESRNSDTLRPYVGKRVSIVRTGEGPAKAIGEVTVGEPMIVDKKKFRSLEHKHHVPEGSKFDINTSTKHLYPMHDPVRYEKERDVNHGIIARQVINKSDGGDVHLTKEQAAANKKKFLAASTEKRRMYHGSRHYGKDGVNEELRSEGGIREFNTGMRGMAFVSPGKGVANEYAGGNKLKKGSSGAVYPVHVQVKNPFDYENPEHVDRLAKNLPKANSIWSVHYKKTPAQIREKLATGNWAWIEDSQVMQTAKKLGHDGMYMQETDGGFGKNVKHLGVFDTRYIKSAIGNRGTYDTEDYDITKSKGGLVGKAQMQWELMRKKKV